MSRGRIILIVALLGMWTVSCRPDGPAVEPTPAVDFTQELPPGQLALRKISPGEYPAFSIDQAGNPAIVKAIDNSLQYLAAPSSQGFYPYLDITHNRAIATLNAMRELLSSPMLLRQGDAYLNATLRSDFEVYQSIGAPDPVGGSFTGRVLFTGYFTPIYPASLQRTDVFRYPLYKRPVDLVRNDATGDVLGRKLPDGSLAPKYYTRGEIEAGNLLAGQELVWLNNRFDAYVISVQGSARLILTDGRTYEIGYAGHNGFEYTSPGEQLVKDGRLSKQQLNLRGLKTYFAQHPSDMDRYLSLNKRFVFFTERTGGPFGSLNVPVTALATIATDKSIYPRAMPAFVWTKIPAPQSVTGAREYRSILLDQDAGGAIRAAGRTDIYMGVGESAERLAGQQLHEGKLYYFAVKPELVSRYLITAGPRLPRP